MKTIEEIRQGFIDKAQNLKEKAKKEPNKLKAKDMNGMAKGFLSAANELKNYLGKDGVESELELEIDSDITPDEVYVNGQRFRQLL